MEILEVGERRVGVLPVDGRPVAAPTDALDLIGDAWGTGADAIAVPVGRLGAEFFDLRSGIAGEIAQKLVNYRLQLVVVGDISTYTARSGALADWVRESNRGHHVWFVVDLDELRSRLAPDAP